jgi:hypothetical protein
MSMSERPSKIGILRYPYLVVLAVTNTVASGRIFLHSKTLAHSPNGEVFTRNFRGTPTL